MKKKMASAKAALPVQRTPTPSARNESHRPAEDVQVRIAARAHELYVQRGYLHGYHLHDWLEAEQEILSQARDTGRLPVFA